MKYIKFRRQRISATEARNTKHEMYFKVQSQTNTEKCLLDLRHQNQQMHCI